MTYRFVIISDEINNFRRDIKIDAAEVFEVLRLSILKSIGFTLDGMETFTVCDSKWTPVADIVMEDTGYRMEDEVYLMRDTPIDSFVTDVKQKLVFTFDLLGDRSLYMELREITFDDQVSEPIVVRSQGDPPRQESSVDEILAAPITDTESDLTSEELTIDDADSLDSLGLDIEDDLS